MLRNLRCYARNAGADTVSKTDISRDIGSRSRRVGQPLSVKGALLLQTKIEFGFGVGEDATGAALAPDLVIAGLMVIRKRAAELFGGYTMHAVNGGWTNPEGRLVEEPGYTLFVFGPGNGNMNGTILALVDCIKENLHQAAVCVTFTEVNTRVV